MLKLRPYQEAPVKKAVEFFRLEDPEPALMVWPTAAGKSILAAEVAAEAGKVALHAVERSPEIGGEGMGVVQKTVANLKEEISIAFGG